MATLPPPPSSGEQIPDNLSRWLYLAYAAINSFSGGSTGTFGPPGVNTPGAALVASSNRSLDYLNLSQLSLHAVNVLSSATEINQLFTSGISRASLISLVSFDSGVHSTAWAVDAQVGGTIRVNLGLRDAFGGPINQPVVGEIWLSETADGITLPASLPDGGVVAGDGTLITITSTPASVYFKFISTSDGVVSFDVLSSVPGTWYLATELPYSMISVSSEITFI